ncbi:hypothetical protein BH11PSE4_BH11PSE4_42790 [soil metagenome]
MFPRHTRKAVVTQATLLDLRRRQRNLLHWLRVAHPYFAMREAETRAG